MTLWDWFGIFGAFLFGSVFAGCVVAVCPQAPILLRLTTADEMQRPFVAPKILTLPFRAMRFAFHLIRIGHGKALWQEFIAEVYSWTYWPELVLLAKRNNWRAEVVTEYPVAFQSADHLNPHGTAKNFKTNYGFVMEMRHRFGGVGSVLDLGCSSGRMIANFDSVGWRAVGLEGSDFSKKHQRACWNTHADRCLFTADIGQPFSVFDPDGPVKFDVITSWDVVEHLTSEQLAQLALNIRQHSHAGTLLIITTDNTSEKPDGVELHVTRWERSEWLTWFTLNLPEFELCEPLRPHQMVRRSARGFNFFLKRKDDK